VGIGGAILLRIVWGPAATLATERYQAHHWFDFVVFGLAQGSIYALIGMVEAFSQRFIISEGIALGQTPLLLVSLFASYQAARRALGAGASGRLLNGMLASLTAAALLEIFVLLGTHLNLRKVFINASPFFISCSLSSRNPERESFCF